MRAYHSDTFVLPLPPGHPFPMTKYRLLRDAAEASMPGIRVAEAPPASDGELALAHEPAWIDAVVHGTTTAAQQREIGFPWSERMVERARRSVGASIAAARTALFGGGQGPEGVAANLAGGTHHAYAHKGSGYCVFNDVAVAARLMQAEWHRARRALLRVIVIDLDVHQGNGTASIFRDDDTVFTLSLHGAKNLAFYLAGADPHENDRLGRLKISSEGLAERDRRVLAALRERGIPVALSMAGGYGRDLDTTVAVQRRTLELALESWRSWSGAARQEAA